MSLAGSTQAARAASQSRYRLWSASPAWVASDIGEALRFRQERPEQGVIVLRLDFVLDRRIPQEILTLDRDFLERGAAMGADCSDRVVFGGAGGVVRGLGDGIARERLIEAGETECLPRFEDGSGLFPERGRQRGNRRRLFEL